MIHKIRKLLGARGLFENIVTAAFSAWFLVSIFTGSFEDTGSLNFYKTQNFLMILLFFLITWIVMYIVIRLFEHVGRLLFLAVVLFYAMLCILHADNLVFALAICIVPLLVLYYVRGSVAAVAATVPLTKNALVVSYIILGVFCAGFISLVTVFRYLTYSTPGFDFGIFAQMFEYIKETGLPNTTYERSKLLSHFAVHFSPVFYLILPFYILFPSPATLQVAQAVALSLGLIPLYLLCRHHHLSFKISLAVGICYVFYPALAGGTYYDLHETCFYTVCILFLLWAIETRRNIWFVVFMLLTMSIKEEAPIYLVFIALYFLFSGRDRKRGGILLVSALAYFGVALAAIQAFGGEVMTSRCANFMYNSEENGMIQMIKAVFMNPGYTLAECFSEDRLEYLAYMLLPLSGVMLCNKKYSQFILLGPFLLLNLMPDWQYQHDIHFQYNFGNVALFFYIAVLNAAAFRPQRIRVWAACSCVVSVLLFCASDIKHIRYLNMYLQNTDRYTQMSELLQTIPEEASVSASTFLVPHLSGHRELYPISTQSETDYIVVDNRYAQQAQEDLKVLDQLGGYRQVGCFENVLTIYKK